MLLIQYSILLVWFLIRIFIYLKFIFNVQNGKYPQLLIDFPILENSPSDYIKIIEKVKEFRADLQSKKRVELRLNEIEFNSLYNKGTVINKYKPGLYYYYYFKKDCILERKFEWFHPFFATLISPYDSNTTTIYFQQLIEYRNTTQNFKQIEIEKTFPVTDLSQSRIIMFILGGIASTVVTGLNYEQTKEFKQALFLLEALRNIEISNNHLILRS